VKRTDITSIGRAVDLTYPTNRAIAVATALLTVGGLFWRRLAGVPWLSSAAWGAQVGLTVFLTWALCRELDPDHDQASFVAAGLALVGVAVWSLPKLTAVLWLLILVRIVNRTTGLAAGVLDALGLVGLGGWLSLQGTWGYGFITATALFLDSRLPDPARGQLVFALLSAVVTALAAGLAVCAPPEAPSLTGGLVGLGLSFVFLPVILSVRSLDSVGDETGERLAPARVRAAQILALFAGVALAFLEGPSALVTLAPLWASVIGASSTWLHKTLTSFDARP
jgi:hypothetical protein